MPRGPLGRSQLNVSRLALGHLITGIAECLTIIGIPLGLANFKLIPVSLLPLGREIMSVDEARARGLGADAWI